MYDALLQLMREEDDVTEPLWLNALRLVVVAVVLSSGISFLVAL